MPSIGLERATAHPGWILMVGTKTTNVHRPEIEGRLPGGDPFGKRHASAAGRSDAKGVEARPDEEIAHFWRLADHPVDIGRKAFQPVDHLLHAGRPQRGD